MTDLPTEYESSDGKRRTPIAEMPWTYLNNAIGVVSKRVQDDKTAKMLTALRNEAERRPSPAETGTEVMHTPHLDDPPRAPTTIGHNSGDLSEMIAAAYSPIRLADDHAALAARVQDLSGRAGALTVVDNDESNKLAGELVVELRAAIKEVDDTCDTVKDPVYRAYEGTLSFFNGLNRSDPKKNPGVLTRNKVRLEAAISTRAFVVAEAARQARLAQEKIERDRAQKEADAARAAEEANRPQVAEVLINEAVKSDAIADTHAAVAQGPIQDLARTRTGSSVTGLRAEPGFDIVDIDALRDDLGTLGRSFTADAVHAAIRKFRLEGEAYSKWAFRDDDQNSQRRVVVAKPELPGVEFFIEYKGSVRA